MNEAEQQQEILMLKDQKIELEKTVARLEQELDEATNKKKKGKKSKR